jgi:hypothetical protein
MHNYQKYRHAGFTLPLNNPSMSNLLGAYFTATNPTPGTGIPMGIQTTFSDTDQVLMLMYNGGDKRIVLDYLKLICTAAGASTTFSNLVIKLSNKDRYTSGGSSITPSQPNGPSRESSITKFYFGNIIANALGTLSKVAGRSIVKVASTPCFVIGDQFIMTFGTRDVAAGFLLTTTPSVSQLFSGPIIIAPGWSLTLHMWNTDNAVTPPSWEFDVGYFEMEA